MAYLKSFNMTVYASVLLLLLISSSVRALGNSLEVNERRLRCDSDDIFAVLVGRNALGRKLFVVSLDDENSMNVDLFKTISATYKSSEGGAFEPIKFNFSSLDLGSLLSRCDSDSNDAIHVTIPSSVGWQLITAYVEWRLELENIELELQSDVEVMVLPRSELAILKRGWQDPSGPFSVHLYVRKKVWAGGQDSKRRCRKAGAEPVVEKGACSSLVRQLHEYLISLQSAVGQATKTWTSCGLLTEVSTVVSVRCITDLWLYGGFPWLFDSTTSLFAMAFAKAWIPYPGLPPPLPLLRQLLREPLFLLAVLFFACFLLPYISNQPKKKQAKDRHQQQQRIAMKIRSQNVQTATCSRGCSRLGYTTSRLQKWWLAAVASCKSRCLNLWLNLKSSTTTLCCTWWRNAVGALSYLAAHFRRRAYKHRNPIHNNETLQQSLLPSQDQLLEQQKLKRAEKRNRRIPALQPASSDPSVSSHQPPPHSPKSPLTPSDPLMPDATVAHIKLKRGTLQFSEDCVKMPEFYYGPSDAVAHLSSNPKHPQQRQGHHEAPIARKPSVPPASVTVSATSAALDQHRHARHAAVIDRQLKHNEHAAQNHHHEGKRLRSGHSAAADSVVLSGAGDLVSYFSWSSGVNGGGGAGGKGMFGAGIIGDSGCCSRAESDASHASSCGGEIENSSSSSNGGSGGSSFSLWTAFRVVTIEAVSDEPTLLSTDEPCPAPPRGSSPSGPIAPPPRYGDSDSSAASSPLGMPYDKGICTGTTASPSPLATSSPSTPMSPLSPPQLPQVDGHDNGYMYGINGNDFSLWNPFGTSLYGLPGDVTSTHQWYGTYMYGAIQPFENTTTVTAPMYGTASRQVVYAPSYVPSYQPMTASQAAHNLYCNWYGYGCGYCYGDGYGYGHGGGVNNICIDGAAGCGILDGTVPYMYGNTRDVKQAYESHTIWANGPLRGFVHELPGVRRGCGDWSAAAT